MVRPDLYSLVPPSPSWSQGRCDVFAGCPDMGVILKGFGGAGKGPPDLRCHLCTSALLLGAGAQPLVLAAVSHTAHDGSGKRAVTWPKATRKGGQAPGTGRLCACTLVPNLLPGAWTCMYTRALSPPACTGAVLAAAVPAVGAALPSHLSNELPRCGDSFFFSLFNPLV